MRSLPGAIEGSRDVVGFPGSQGACHPGRDFARWRDGRFLDGCDGNRKKHAGGNGRRHDGSMTDGSNLDHFMCEICARDRARSGPPVSAREGFRWREACAPSPACGGGSGRGPQRFLREGAGGVCRAPVSPLQLSPASGERAALRAWFRATLLPGSSGLRLLPNPPPRNRCVAGEGGEPAQWRRLRGREDYAAMARAESSACEDVTEPKMPPCALIIARPASWKCGKYEPQQSESTMQR